MFGNERLRTSLLRMQQGYVHSIFVFHTLNIKWIYLFISSSMNFRFSPIFCFVCFQSIFDTKIDIYRINLESLIELKENICLTACHSGMTTRTHTHTYIYTERVFLHGEYRWIAKQRSMAASAKQCSMQCEWIWNTNKQAEHQYDGTVLLPNWFRIYSIG